MLQVARNRPMAAMLPRSLYLEGSVSWPFRRRLMAFRRVETALKSNLGHTGEIVERDYVPYGEDLEGPCWAGANPGERR
jgi:hypothetical protein